MGFQEALGWFGAISLIWLARAFDHGVNEILPSRIQRSLLFFGLDDMASTR